MMKDRVKKLQSQSLLLAGVFVLGLAGVAHAEIPNFSEARIALSGSEPHAIAIARHLGATDPDEKVSVSLVLRRSNADEFANLISALHSGNKLARPIAREELAARYGASQEDLAAAQQFAADHQLTVESADQASRLVVLSGSAAQINAAFGVELHSYAQAEGSFHSHVGEVQLPLALAGAVQGVVGLDNRALVRPHFQINPDKKPKPTPVSGGALTQVTPAQVAHLYDFPQGSGSGECIAILELGGGFNAADLENFFAGVGVKTPTIQALSVDGTQNAPAGDPNSADGEVALDIEVAGALAPDAKILVYFGNGATEQGFLDTIKAAANDASNHCSVMSISWGGPENSFSSSFLTSADQAFQEAAATGMTVFAAAGDDGSTDGTASDVTDFPAASPNVVACGGTNLSATSTQILSEVVWNLTSAKEGATGGGVSKVFPVPSYQSGLKVATVSKGESSLSGRGVPDVAGTAAPTSGYAIVVDGQQAVVGGTSAVSPLYAGLFAIINANRGTPVGFANPSLYAHPEAFNVITSGNNGTYAAAKSWSAATGLGSPKGSAIQAIFVQ